MPALRRLELRASPATAAVLINGLLSQAFTVCSRPSWVRSRLLHAEDGSAAVAVEYGVEFKGNMAKFLTLGEAYIEAGELADKPT